MSVLTLTRQPAAATPAADCPPARRLPRALALPALCLGLLISAVGYLAVTAVVVVALLSLVQG